ncbi:hypothetical protein POTOM_016158 [Populus tomentosa]|uniref:Large ribosomal subunit protein eL24-related N-terminal domain-containing protein n=1 Tax=Populus tomentosa TaxID=118781 RepID=A0A8X8A8G8_POPTO|nr:hypothetical protein POTOM_016158 [Populus tomentosa]
MRLEKCWFCSSTVYPGHGIQFVRNDAKGNEILVLSHEIRVSTAVSVVVHAPNWHVVWVDFVDPLVAGNPRSKCHKNFKMKRNPRKVKWTKAYRRLHGKDMTQDTTFEFERKRNRPERYDRNLAENTLKAIKKIDKVRSDRAASHIEKRLKVRKGKERREAQKELEQSIHLVKAPQVLRQDQSLTLPKIKVEVSQPKSEKNQAMEE